METSSTVPVGQCRSSRSRLMFTGCCLIGCLVAGGSARADDTSSAAEVGPLVQRDQVRLTLAGAQRVIAAALTQAREMQLQVNITVVDKGGHPLAFARMDGARPASAYTSMTKATSAATKLAETGPLGGNDPAGTHLNLAVESAAAQSGGTFTTLRGGVPIVVDDQVIGAVGVGGATGEQDAEIARAGVQALIEAIPSAR